MFIKLLCQHVSGIIMPIIRRTRPCTAAYGVLHCLCYLWLCGAALWAVCTVWKLLFDSNFYTLHTVHTTPIIRRIRPFPTACGVLSGFVGCGWLWLCGAASWAVCTVWTVWTVWKLLSNCNLHTVHTAHDAAPHNHNQPVSTTSAEHHMRYTRSCSPDDGHNDARNMLT